MTRRSLCFVVALLFVPFLSAKDKAAFPKQIVTAQYVLVTTYFSDNLADPSIPPADRQAVIDVQNAIRDWGRYTLVYDRKAAELIFLVRKGRTAEARDSIHIHGGSNQPTPTFGHETQGGCRRSAGYACCLRRRPRHRYYPNLAGSYDRWPEFAEGGTGARTPKQG